jgi:hypothetical protein
MMRIESGSVFGKLTTIEVVKINVAGKKVWQCSCECGGSREVSTAQLRKGVLTSCGCVTKNRTAILQGCKTVHPLYQMYKAMIRRCHKKTCKAYKNYGAFGVEVCFEWRNDFWRFVEDMGDRPDGYSIDRINPFGNYESENCRWATAKEQSENKRSNYVGII